MTTNVNLEKAIKCFAHASHTTMGDINVLRTHIGPLARFLGSTITDDEANSAFNKIVDRLSMLKLELNALGLVKKHACRLKDMIGIMLAFYLFKPAPRHVINIGLYHGMSALSISRVFPDCEVITIEPSDSNIDAFRSSGLVTEKHRILHGTSLHANNLPIENDKYDGPFSGRKNPDQLSYLLSTHETIDAIFIDGDHHYEYCLDELELIHQHCQQNNVRIIVGMHDQQPGRPPYAATKTFMERHSISPYEFTGLNPGSPRIGIIVMGK